MTIMIHRYLKDIMLCLFLDCVVDWDFFSFFIFAVLRNDDDDEHLTLKRAVSDATLPCLHMRFIRCGRSL